MTEIDVENVFNNVSRVIILENYVMLRGFW